MTAPHAARRFDPGDISGGLASAVISITGNIAAGVIAFAPLGPEYVSQGILAGMLSSIVAGLLASLSGSAAGMITGPKATTAMVFAALLSELLRTGEFDLAVATDANVVLALAFSAVLVSGSVQLLLGTFRVGGMVRFMPYPVVAGIRNTTALLLISTQMWPFIGAQPAELISWGAIPGAFRPASLLVGLLTASIALWGGRIMPRPIVPAVALAAGTALHHTVALLRPNARLGEVLGAVDLRNATVHLDDMVVALTDTANFELLGAVLFGALAMAVLDSVSALITLVSYQSIADRRFDANKQLIGQGLGSAAAAVFGGLTTSGILARAAVNHDSGGRTRLSGVVNAIGVLVLVALVAQPIGWIPKAAIAGLILVIATTLFDRWTVGQLHEGLRREAENPRDNLAAVGLMAVVMAVGVVFGLVNAVGAGVGLSVLVFVVQMSRSPIRRIRSGRAVRSARRRDPGLTALLDEHGDRIVVVELEGALFFGSSDALATKAEELAENGADHLLLDLRRVTRVDATGYMVLGQTYKRLEGRGVQVGFSHVVPGRVASEIAEDLIQSGIAASRMFETSDHALQFFEESLIAALGMDETGHQSWDAARFTSSWELHEAEGTLLESYLELRRYEPGDFVVQEGDEGRSLFLLGSGVADVTISVGNRRRRLAAFEEGTVFGEMALLDGAPRAAAISAHTELAVYELTFDAYARLVREHPTTALKVQTALARILGERLRGANALIWELDS